MSYILTLRGTPAEQDRQWIEHVMNAAVFRLYADVSPTLFGLEMCWYIVGEGVTVWREGDGRSPVEPTVPGD